MSRDIKFRAWDKEQNHWVHPIHCVIRLEGEIIDPVRDNETVNAKYVLMQYTGLKDKNGVEIYEGDVVAYRTYTRREGEQYHNREVFWDSDAAMFKMKKLKRSPNDYEPADNAYFKPTTLSKLEVMGNIYENGGLLK